MKKNVITLLLTTAIVLGLASCSDDNKESSISILSVETTSTVNLSDRTGWKFYVGGSEYNYTIDGNKLRATPKSDITTWKVGTSTYSSNGYYAENNNPSYGNYLAGYGAMLRTTFISPDYHMPLIENVEEQPLDQLDQRTPKKMLNGDALSSWYPSITSEHVSGVELTHEHCLVEYTFVDLPEDAETALTSKKYEILPLVEEGVTKAILVSPSANYITAKIGEKTYGVSVARAVASLNKSTQALPSVRDQHYVFEVKYNKDETNASNVLTIQNEKTTQWSKDKTPKSTPEK